MSTDILRVVLADRQQITSPMRSIDCVNTMVILEAHRGFVKALDAAARVCLGVETRSQLDDFMDIVDVELALEVRQTVEHLDRALTVANVENFIDFCLLFDHFNVGYVVVQAHVGPRVHPEVAVLLSVKCFVLLGVSRATIATDPDIVASVHQKQLKRFAFEVVQPRSTVLVVTVLDQNCAFSGLLFAEDVERGEDVFVFGVDFVGLPVVAPLVHYV